jgi:hypothetical protein
VATLEALMNTVSTAGHQQSKNICTVIRASKQRTAFTCGETAHIVRREVISVLAVTKDKKKIIVQWRTVK